MRLAYRRASPFVLHAPAETNLPDKSWSYDRGDFKSSREGDCRPGGGTGARRPPHRAIRIDITLIACLCDCALAIAGMVAVIAGDA